MDTTSRANIIASGFPLTKSVAQKLNQSKVKLNQSKVLSYDEELWIESLLTSRKDEILRELLICT